MRASSTVSDALFVFVPPNNPRRFFSVTEQVVSWNLTNPPRCLKSGTETVQPFLGHFSASKAPLRGRYVKCNVIQVMSFNLHYEIGIEVLNTLSII